MTALCVDDEPIMLASLKEAVEASPNIEKVYAFEEERDALLWMEKNSFDMAFLDIELHEMSGTQLAGLIRERYPFLPVIFCTGYTEYALEAMQLHADGYLLKPIYAEDVQKEIDRILGKADSKALLFVSKNGFSVKDKNGEPVAFSRGRTAELFKLMLEANGEPKTAEELCLLLFGEAPGFAEKNRNYFFHLTNDLRTALSGCDAQEVLVRTGQYYGINMSLVSVTD